MQLTSNYNLKKPDGSDIVNVQDFNDNSDKVDLEFKRVDSSLKEITQKTDKFTEDDNKKLLYNGAKVGATNASEINISSINGLTATNTQQALSQILDKANSAFQCASNGKGTIAGVLGGGCSANNTHQDLANHIQWCKNDLASLVAVKGVSANNSSGLHDLLALVGNISVGSLGGLKYVTGSISHGETINLNFNICAIYIGDVDPSSDGKYSPWFSFYIKFPNGLTIKCGRGSVTNHNHRSYVCYGDFQLEVQSTSIYNRNKDGVCIYHAMGY